MRRLQAGVIPDMQPAAAINRILRFGILTHPAWKGCGGFGNRVNLVGGSMVIRLVRTGALIILLALCMIYPYLPGSYDPMALIFSAMAQVSGIAGLPLVLVGILRSEERR